MTVDQVTLNRLQSTVWAGIEDSFKLPRGILNAIATWETRGSFDNNAFNRGSGARGIFQLTPIALKQVNIDYGLNADPNNVYQASVAAAILLSRYQRLFKGELPLMVAAYNAGEGTVRRFVKQVAANGRGSLPYETRDYIANVVQMI
jgi:soluble lytic murein transglycosylase-like protein